MAARFKMPKEVLLAKYGNIELSRKDGVSYQADYASNLFAGTEGIYCQAHKNTIGAEIMTIKQLVSTGLAQRIFVYTISGGDSHNHIWNHS